MRFVPSSAIVLGIIFLCAHSIWAIPLAQYRRNIHEAATALDDLQSLTVKERAARQAVTFREIRKLLPAKQKIELGNNGGNIDFETDNSWLETSLASYENSSAAERAQILPAVSERLGAIEDRLEEIENAQTVANTQDADKQKLDEILRRPEFQKQSDEKGKSVLTQLLEAIEKWLKSFFGDRPPVTAEPLPRVDLAILNYLVIGLALAIIGFIGWRFLLPLIGTTRGRKKPKKKEPRVILGETLAPDATADDLLTQADRLALSGELRAAIRKGYIAALCDLSDRKVLGLAGHKTNRDYLRDVRQRDEIYQPMNGMTNIFERHWYGDVPPEQKDWETFRGQLTIVNQHSAKN